MSASKAGVSQEEDMRQHKEEQDGESAGRESRNLADVELDTCM
jgi:hypothetical protein